jgi:hypothetical protein
VRRIVLLGAVVWLALTGVVIGGTAASAASPSVGTLPVAAAQVCSLVTRSEVYLLLNYSPATSVGTPQPRFGGGACSWGTGMGETVAVSVGPYPKRLLAHPCGNGGGAAIKVRSWSGCAMLSLANGETMTGYKGSVGVAIQPEVNVLGIFYQNAEEAVISRIFRELRA